MNQASSTNPAILSNNFVQSGRFIQYRATGLDLLKIMGTLLVVILHAAIPYINVPLPGLAWPVHNVTSSSLVTVVFWSIQCFIMPLFFVLAGYAASAMFVKYGPQKYFWLREKRIIYPLFLGMIVILPIETYVCTLSWIADGRYPFAKIYSLKFAGEDERNFWGLSHLWFLLYLGIYVGLHALYEVKKPRSFQIKLNWITLLCCFIGMTMCLWLTPRITLGFRHDFLPFTTNLCYYGIWFTFGLAAFKTNLLAKLTPDFGGICCMTSLVIFGLMYPAIKGHLESDGQLSQMTFLATLFIPLYAAFLIVGLIAISNCWNMPNQTWLKYLTAASFSVYLLHHPLCIITQIGLHRYEFSPLLKFSIVSLISLSTSLAIYETCIRKTWIGEILYGNNQLDRKIPVASESPTLQTKHAA